MKNSSRRFPELDRLKELLQYEPETGYMRWKISRPGPMKAGDIAGTVDSKGYLRVRIDGTDYRGHRLAWFWYYEVYPEEEIDHINRDKLDNRISNLRHADISINVLNRGKQKNNTTGVTGVNWNKQSQRWTASISVGKKARHLGYFDSIESAAEARSIAEKELRRC